MALQPIRMKYSKSTKNTHVYENQDGDVTSLYIKKSAFLGIRPPDSIVLTVAIAANAPSVDEVKP